MSLGNDPSRFRTEEDVLAAERVTEARQARYELSRDGPAPSREAILREMGRDTDGYNVADGPDEFVPASVAARRALEDDRVDDAREQLLEETVDGRGGGRP